MTRQCYQDWGYVLYGEYLGMYSDNDYTQRAQLESRAVWALDLMFKHNHFTTNGTAADRTYLHGNESAKYTLGRRFLETRRQRSFK